MTDHTTTSDLSTVDASPAGVDDAPAAGTEPTHERSARALVVPALVGAAISVSLGAYGRLHDPTLESITTFGFPAVLPMKAWFATVAAVLALAQAASAAWIWGRLPGAGAAPSWIGHAHRWTGTLAFLISLPVAYHCLWSLGFQDTSTRVLAHSLLGCAFYGAFATKMLVLRSQRAPGWALPVMGGALVTLLVALWWTSSWWFFTTFGFPGV